MLNSRGCCAASFCLSPVGSAVSGVVALRPLAAAVGRQPKPSSSTPPCRWHMLPRLSQPGGDSSRLHRLLLLPCCPLTLETDQVTRSRAAPNLDERNQRHSAVTTHTETHTRTKKFNLTFILKSILKFICSWEQNQWIWIIYRWKTNW